MNRYKIIPKDDELYHWKYIRKEKLPNGKWRYYYPDYDKKMVPDEWKDEWGDLDEDEKNIEALLRSRHIKDYGDPIDVLYDKLGYDEQRRYKSAKNWTESYNRLANNTSRILDDTMRDMKSDGDYSEWERGVIKKFEEDPAHWYSKYKQWKPVADQMLKEYEKTPLYKIEKAKSMVKKGAKKVAKLLNIKHDGFGEDELQHYGVLGMKWGVRRGRTAQAYAKASKKLTKLDTKAEKQRAKARKKASKAERMEFSRLASKKKKAKYAEKARTSSYNAARRIKKAKKWYDRMENTFKDTTVSLSAEQKALGKKYVEALNLRAELKYA